MCMDLKKQIGHRIKECRINAKLTQSAVAAALNIPQQQIGRYETGKIIPSVENLIVLCKFFAVTSDYIIGLSEI